MSAEAAALQQLRGLVAALGAGDAAALRDGTVTSLRAAANAVSRLARDASPELARGSWETALELWCAAFRARALLCAARPANCSQRAWHSRAACATRAVADQALRARGRNVVVTLSNATPAAGVQAARCAQLRAIARCVAPSAAASARRCARRVWPPRRCFWRLGAPRGSSARAPALAGGRFCSACKSPAPWRCLGTM